MIPAHEVWSRVAEFDLRVGDLEGEQQKAFVDRLGDVERDEHDFLGRELFLVLKRNLIELRLVDALDLARKVVAHSLTMVRRVFGVKRSSL